MCVNDVIPGTNVSVEFGALVGNSSHFKHDFERTKLTRILVKFKHKAIWLMKMQSGVVLNGISNFFAIRIGTAAMLISYLI